MPTSASRLRKAFVPSVQGGGGGAMACLGPFAAVDAQTRAELEDPIRSSWERPGVTVLFVTHDIDEPVDLGQRMPVLSSSPTVVRDDVVVIDLPDDLDQQRTSRPHGSATWAPGVRAHPEGCSSAVLPMSCR
jgi:ABC-type molybdate transport system ATPase subunit